MRRKIQSYIPYILFLLLAIAIPIGFELNSRYLQHGLVHYTTAMKPRNLVHLDAELDVYYVYQAVSKTELQRVPFVRGEGVSVCHFNPSLEGTYYTVDSEGVRVKIFKEPDINFAIEDIINYDELVVEYESRMIEWEKEVEEAKKGYKQHFIMMIVIYLILTVILFAFFSSLYAVISDRIKKRKAKRIEND